MAKIYEEWAATRVERIMKDLSAEELRDSPKLRERIYEAMLDARTILTEMEK